MKSEFDSPWDHEYKNEHSRKWMPFLFVIQEKANSFAFVGIEPPERCVNSEDRDSNSEDRDSGAGR